jgi:CheY-like chemotaxis protein
LSDGVAFLNGKRCLVLDDEYLIALDIQQILEAAGAAGVICVSSVGHALEAMNKGSKFDLAVLDFKLDNTDVSSLAVAVLLSERGTPFIFLSGARPDEIRAGSFAHVPVVEKPYQAAILIEAVRLVLAGK